MTIGPVLMAGLILAPILLMDSSDEEKRKYGFVMKIIFLNLNLKMLMEPIISFLKRIFQVKDLYSSEGYALVYIPKFENQNIDLLESSVKVYVHKPMSLSNQNQISNNIESVIESIKLKEEG